MPRWGVGWATVGVRVLARLWARAGWNWRVLANYSTAYYITKRARAEWNWRASALSSARRYSDGIEESPSLYRMPAGVLVPRGMSVRSPTDARRWRPSGGSSLIDAKGLRLGSGMAPKGLSAWHASECHAGCGPYSAAGLGWGCIIISSGCRCGLMVMVMVIYSALDFFTRLGQCE